MRNESGEPKWLVPVIVALLLAAVAVGLTSMLSSGLAAQRSALQTIAISTAPPPTPAATLASTPPPPTAAIKTPSPTAAPTSAPTIVPAITPSPATPQPAAAATAIQWRSFTGYAVVQEFFIGSDGYPVSFAVTLQSGLTNSGFGIDGGGKIDLRNNPYGIPANGSIQTALVVDQAVVLIGLKNAYTPSNTVIRPLVRSDLIKVVLANASLAGIINTYNVVSVCIVGPNCQ